MIPLEAQFTYHPPTTEERTNAHKLVNEASLAFAKIIDKLIKNEENKRAAILALQTTRMLVNQGITYDELVDKFTNSDI